MSRHIGWGSNPLPSLPYHYLPQDDDCPDYEAAVSRSNSNVTSKGMSILSESAHWSENTDILAPLNVSRHPSRLEYKRYVYTYNLMASSTPLQFYISVEPFSGQPTPGKYQFRLSMRANGIERPIGEPVTRQMTVDPRTLEFKVFVFPGKQGIPVGCLWCVRVWLNAASEVGHRLFGEDDLWVGKNPDFNSIGGDASFARQRALSTNHQMYVGYVGKALVTFTVRWQRVRDSLYKYSLEYDGGGVGDMLFSDLRLRVDGNPQTVSFLIYTIPSQSMPPGATHKIRVWLRSLVPLSSDPASSQPLPFNDSYIYQRIFKMDDLKIGGSLRFSSMGSKLVMASSNGGPETISMARSPIKNIDQVQTKETKDKERDKDARRERERDKDIKTSNMVPQSTSSHQHQSSHSHPQSSRTHPSSQPLPPPPGAQLPAHMANMQGGFSQAGYYAQNSSHYPHTQTIGTSGRHGDRVRSPPPNETRIV